MAVTVIRGLSTTPTGTSGQSAANPQNQSSVAQLQSAATQVSASSTAVVNVAKAATSDAAAVSYLKSSRGASAAEKIRNYDDAKERAADVAEKIRDDNGSTKAHGDISTQAAREHLAN